MPFWPKIPGFKKKSKEKDGEFSADAIQRLSSSDLKRRSLRIDDRRRTHAMYEVPYDGSQRDDAWLSNPAAPYHDPASQQAKTHFGPRSLQPGDLERNTRQRRTVHRFARVSEDVEGARSCYETSSIHRDRDSRSDVGFNPRRNSARYTHSSRISDITEEDPSAVVYSSQEAHSPMETQSEFLPPSSRYERHGDRRRSERHRKHRRVPRTIADYNENHGTRTAPVYVDGPSSYQQARLAIHHLHSSPSKASPAHSIHPLINSESSRQSSPRARSRQHDLEAENRRLRQRIEQLMQYTHSNGNEHYGTARNSSTASSAQSNNDEETRRWKMKYETVRDENMQLKDYKRNADRIIEDAGVKVAKAIEQNRRLKEKNDALRAELKNNQNLLCQKNLHIRFLESQLRAHNRGSNDTQSTYNMDRIDENAETHFTAPLPVHGAGNHRAGSALYETLQRHTPRTHAHNAVDSLISVNTHFAGNDASPIFAGGEAMSSRRESFTLDASANTAQQNEVRHDLNTHLNRLTQALNSPCTTGSHTSSLRRPRGETTVPQRSMPSSGFNTGEPTPRSVFTCNTQHRMPFQTFNGNYDDDERINFALRDVDSGTSTAGTQPSPLSNNNLLVKEHHLDAHRDLFATAEVPSTPQYNPNIYPDIEVGRNAVQSPPESRGVPSSIISHNPTADNSSFTHRSASTPKCSKSSLNFRGGLVDLRLSSIPHTSDDGYSTLPSGSTHCEQQQMHRRRSRSASPPLHRPHLERSLSCSILEVTELTRRTVQKKPPVAPKPNLHVEQSGEENVTRSLVEVPPLRGDTDDFSGASSSDSCASAKKQLNRTKYSTEPLKRKRRKSQRQNMSLTSEESEDDGERLIAAWERQLKVKKKTTDPRVRYTPPRRTILRTDVYTRFGQVERKVLEEFDFLKEINTDLSGSDTQATPRVNKQKTKAIRTLSGVTEEPISHNDQNQQPSLNHSQSDLDLRDAPEQVYENLPYQIAHKRQLAQSGAHSDDSSSIKLDDMHAFSQSMSSTSSLGQELHQ